jgi:four helix bundle protein
MVSQHRHAGQRLRCQQISLKDRVADLGREFHQFLGNARGSLMELDTHLELALRVGYMNVEKHTAIRAQLDEVGRILNGLMRSISSGI